jgi:hypothetical protein
MNVPPALCLAGPPRWVFHRRPVAAPRQSDRPATPFRDAPRRSNYKQALGGRRAATSDGAACGGHVRRLADG